MKKLKQFTREAEYYYQKAIDKADAGDYIGSLEFLRRAQRLSDDPYGDDDLSIRLEIAAIYSEMGLFPESNREYYFLTAFDYGLDEVYYGLVKNYALMEMPEQAAYYLNFAVEAGILLPEDGFEPIDLGLLKKSGDDPAPHLRLLKKDDARHAVQAAKQLLCSADTEFARRILLSVPQSSAQFNEASNYLALIEIGEGNVEEGLAVCNRVLESEPQNLYALSTRILALEMDGRKAEARAAIAALDVLDFDGWPETARVALCAAQVGAQGMAYKYLRRALGFMPYDRELLLLLVLAAANLGKFSEAKDAAVILQTLYPSDITVRHYAREIDKAMGVTESEELGVRSEERWMGREKCTTRNAQRTFLDESGNHSSNHSSPLTPHSSLFFEMIPELPKAEAKRFGELIEKTLERVSGTGKLVRAMEKDELLAEAVQWGITPGNVYSLALGRALSRDPEGYPIVRELLLDPDYPIIPKKEMFLELLRCERVREIQMTVNHQIHWYRPAVPAKGYRNLTMLAAYRKVYSALAFIDSGFDRKLNFWYKKVSESLEAAGVTECNENAAAAVLAYKSHINKIFSLIPYACEVFNCSEEEFMVLYDKLNAEAPQTKKVPKKAKAPKTPKPGKKSEDGF
ncbi:MAG: hypothetical protein FWD58_00025 [Firmicutes bacterium]|nr:hypothetical protein [Bacillota bacterium]